MLRFAVVCFIIAFACAFLAVAGGAFVKHYFTGQPR
jgi:hypothetical protein